MLNTGHTHRRTCAHTRVELKDHVAGSVNDSISEVSITVRLTRLERNVAANCALVVFELRNDWQQCRGESGQENMRQGREAR